MFGLVLTPLVARLMMIGVISLGVAGAGAGIYFKIRHNAVSAERAKIEKEKQDAISNANFAKDRLRALCAESPDRCVSEQWLRD